MTDPNKRQNALIPFFVTVVIPALILMKLSDDQFLGAWRAFFVALGFPLVYSLFEVFQKSRVNWIALLGLANVLITGGFGLMKLEGIWFAMKEASIPLTFGLFILISLRWEKPLIHRVIFNKALFDVEFLKQSLSAKRSEAAFNSLLKKMSLILASSFFLSSLLNFFLAYFILKSPVGTSEFNKEFVHMQLLSYPVIVLPSIIIAILPVALFIRSIPRLTGHTIDKFFLQK